MKEGCEVQMSERESRYFSLFLYFFHLILVGFFWTGVYFVWDGNMAVLQPQMDKPADRGFPHPNIATLLAQTHTLTHHELTYAQN